VVLDVTVLDVGVLGGVPVADGGQFIPHHVDHLTLPDGSI
jgi:hypothetical protein